MERERSPPDRNPDAGEAAGSATDAGEADEADRTAGDAGEAEGADRTADGEGDGSDESPAGASLSPEAAFGVLGDGTRLAVLRELAAVLRESPADPGLSYTHLRERVGVSDAGNFNYHLDRLRPAFVRKEDGQYHVTARGLTVVGTVLAGTFEARDPAEAAVEGTCFVCGGALTATHERGTVRVACEAGHAMLANTFPAGGAVDRDLATVLDIVDRITRHETALAREGVCANCYGDVEAAVGAGEAVANLYRARCDRCGYRLQGTPGTFVTDLPAVVAFYHDHGVDATAVRDWELGLVRDEGTATDGGGVRVSDELDGERLAVAFDADGTVRDVRRE